MHSSDATFERRNTLVNTNNNNSIKRLPFRRTMLNGFDLTPLATDTEAPFHVCASLFDFSLFMLIFTRQTERLLTIPENVTKMGQTFIINGKRCKID